MTLPSHASILTGRYPYEHGIRDNTGYRLRSTEQTAATRLKGLGFATGAFIGGFPLDRRFGLSVGFDAYDDTLTRAAAGADGERERRADAVVSAALGWIGRQSGKWFAWVHVYDPHVVYEPPAEWAARFPSDPYLGEVSWTDFALGPLFDRLRAQPRPTLVVVTSDHGEGLGDHGELTHSVFAYEATLRVPLIVGEVAAGPGDESRGTLSRGVVIDTPVRHVDLLPTLLDVVGAPANSAAGSGSSLREVVPASPRLRRTSGDGDRPSYFEAMTPTLTRGWAPLRGVIAGRDKFIDLPVAELYDLAADPSETRNLAAARTDRGQVLLNTLKTFDVAPPGRPRAETPDTIERLRSLGYIGGAAAPARERYTEDDDPKRLIEIEQMMTRAAQASDRRQPHEAIELYQRVIARRSDTEDAYRKLALVYWRLGRPRDAIATLELALKNHVTQSEVRIKLGSTWSKAARPIAPLRCSSRPPERIRTRSSRSATPTRSPAAAATPCGRSSGCWRSTRGAASRTRTSASRNWRRRTTRLPRRRFAARSISIPPWPARIRRSASCWPRLAGGLRRSTRGRAPSRLTTGRSTRCSTSP